ncbi:MerR family transcriptional regulator [Actinoplanes teichomyceticus]|uniref:DNA-binding transcriptional MerR regulator n=1 Tax=Actinoplanes teichomyceticus TaxID=1867 RepID=A0A561WMY2_ACTTI|nr:MerR family transcriptional regulator [Actinoplanes teichomyceticus]TWG25216.1 DNA-binding transcriptional MerR regulator [Actinoplanes teichomyceticus]GIF10285.1 MerR family transcriptional regulator [Actinoplanes teichomyceticus]
MRIGDLAARAGVSVRSVRYYEEQGLLTSVRSPSGQRHYTDHEVDRVAFIQRLYTAGLSSRTIAELLPCVDAPSLENADAAMQRMAQERDRLSAHIDELIRTRDSLDRLMAVSAEHRTRLRPGSGGLEQGDALDMLCHREAVEGAQPDQVPAQ